MKTYIIRYGTNGVARFYTDYHAAQFCRALDLNGTAYTLTECP